jgi:hypothetical protein
MYIEVKIFELFLDAQAVTGPKTCSAFTVTEGPD